MRGQQVLVAPDDAAAVIGAEFCALIMEGITLTEGRVR